MPPANETPSPQNTKNQADVLFNQGIEAYTVPPELNPFDYDYTVALARFHDALTLYQQLGLQFEQAECLNAMGLAYSQSRIYDEAEKYYDQALEIFETLHAPEKAARVLNNLGVLKTHMAHDVVGYERALSFFEQATEKNSTENGGFIDEAEQVRIAVNSCFVRKAILDKQNTPEQIIFSRYRESIYLARQIEDYDLEVMAVDRLMDWIDSIFPDRAGAGGGSSISGQTTTPPSPPPRRNW